MRVTSMPPMGFLRVKAEGELECFSTRILGLMGINFGFGGGGFFVIFLEGGITFRLGFWVGWEFSARMSSRSS